WAISAVVRCVQQLAINKYLGKKSTDELIAENQKKAAKKREKKGTSAKEINRMATTSTRNVEDKKKSKISEAEREERLKNAAQYTKSAKPGSLASKANMVSKYNSGHSTTDKKDEGK
ncbi:stage III sporulation protein J, partial [Romboutsia ilealis]|nr:stage III sporulation protein J [Romboutsia ilealis]